MTHKPVSQPEEQVRVISSLDRDCLRNWIIDLVEGRDVILESDDEGDTFYPVLAVCRLAAPVVQQRISEAVADLLANTIKSEPLPSQFLSNLLLLAQILEVHDVRDGLEGFARSAKFVALDVELKYRILQTLISLNANLRPSFWYRMLDLEPERFAGVVFDGLALVSPNHAVDFLSRAPNDEEAVRQIDAGLAGFMDDVVAASERASVRNLIESRINEMQPLVANAIADFFASEETPISFLKLELVAQPVRSLSEAKISPEAFPMLAALGERLDQVLSSRLNPARMFRRLAHQ